MRISEADIRAYFNRVGSVTLPTIGGNADFTARLEGNHIAVTPAGGMVRVISMSELWKVLSIYNAGGSIITSDYAGVTQNSSYLLAIIESVRKGKQQGERLLKSNAVPRLPTREECMKALQTIAHDLQPMARFILQTLFELRATPRTPDEIAASADTRRASLGYSMNWALGRFATALNWPAADRAHDDAPRAMWLSITTREDGQTLWQMRPELAGAIEDLGWFSETTGSAPIGHKELSPSPPAITDSDGGPQVFVFWTEHESQRASRWLGAELLQGRLRQGWGLQGMSLVDEENRLLDSDTWRTNFVSSARAANLGEEVWNEKAVRSRHRILVQMLDLRSGDLLVIPKKPTQDEIAFALVDGEYRFDLADGERDFGHVIPVKIDSIKVVREDAIEVAAIAGRFSFYRSAINSVRQPEFAQQIWEAYARLGGILESDVEHEDPYTDVDNTTPDRVTTTIRRIVRDTAKGRALKARYRHACQVCGTSIRLPGRQTGYVEVHHLVPLGQPYAGNDDWNNMIVVCPNCHVAFDFGAYRIHPTTLRLHTSEGEGGIRFVEGHRLSLDNLDRHWRLGEGKTEARSQITGFLNASAAEPTSSERQST